MRTRALLAAVAALPLTLWAHGFDERHDLPAPLTHFMAGAALAVALSFVLAVVFARSAPALAADGRDQGGATFGLPTALRLTLRLASLLLFGVTVAAALAGTADPMMNLAPTLVWIVWWVGLSLVVACIGNIWPLLDPWATLFDGADAVARSLGSRSGLSLQWRWPAALGVWPAVALLLAWSWLEIVYPLAAVPWHLGCGAVAWTVITLLGMFCFGRERWQRNGDVFAIYFALLGRMAPAALRADGRGVVLRTPGSALVAPPQGRELPAGGVAFVLAMLSTVLFDGLHASQAWPWFEGVLAHAVPHGTEVGPKAAGTAGLVLVWLAFLLAYGLTCWMTAKAEGGASAASVARNFAPTLVPIAVGYNVAHNFSSLVEQGQNMLYLLSDPFGWHWDLFGTAQLHTRSGLV
ncbi:MAG: hypothetical protein JWQ33_1364, partial [Ramlibacter sp.]|nr:hypothetical protein [Ramlibacter sp.]